MSQTSNCAPHVFSESLASSHRASDLPLWEELYRKAFPLFLAMHDHRQDGPHQRNGVDRSIILANSKQILVDEKTRGVNRKTQRVYDDIALEYWSDVDRKVPGWVCKPLMCDYIAYAIVPLGKGYLLPVVQLQIAWKAHGETWIKQYQEKNNGRLIAAVNEFNGRRWTTVSVGVEVKDLFKAIGAALRIEFEKIEDYQD
jgi:hypothetical protein